MVHCAKCGTKNDESAKYCSKCGASFEVSMEKRLERGAEEFGRRAEEWGKRFGRRSERECFGLPHGGAIFGLFIGSVILLAGIFFVLERMGLVQRDFELIWPFVVIVFGLLFVAGAIYSLTRR
jgi:hypothetical protein